MALNLNKDMVYKAAKPKEKDYSINDGGGLFLFVGLNGSKLWRFVYTFQGNRKKLAFGAYPGTSTETARRRAEEARQQIANNIDPSEIKKQTKAIQKAARINEDRLCEGLPIVGSFADIAEQWLKSIANLNSTGTLFKKKNRLTNWIFPHIGSKPINGIKSVDIMTALKPLIDAGKLDSAHRLRAEISAIFAYAIVHNLTEYDPAQPVAKQIPAQKVKHRAAIIDPRQVASLLRDIANYQGTFVVQSAFKLSPMLFQRPGEIRKMLWSDIDFDTKEWRPHVTKRDFHHIVPLPTQAVEILKAIQPLTGGDQYVFPSCRRNGRPMSENTIMAALKSLGYDSSIMTAHGFRTTASTLLNEQGWSPDAIERQLSHSPKDKVRAAYNRAQYLDERRRMMQSWADYLDTLKNGASIIPFKQVNV